ncbi:hypothetical protein NDU88_003766 [Pleurodeles waltl]|uniref:Uncharacterized protein n=1 Tax=Pleurodeles waltl TaxID=8319 RepID=A0AAV7MRJ4_PLEWA|nr:hypothetical protein NDU88_003766 [Pleurodeles waltl]
MSEQGHLPHCNILTNPDGCSGRPATLLSHCLPAARGYFRAISHRWRRRDGGAEWRCGLGLAWLEKTGKGLGAGTDRGDAVGLALSALADEEQRAQMGEGEAWCPETGTLGSVLHSAGPRGPGGTPRLAHGTLLPTLRARGELPKPNGALCEELRKRGRMSCSGEASPRAGRCGANDKDRPRVESAAKTQPRRKRRRSRSRARQAQLTKPTQTQSEKEKLLVLHAAASLTETNMSDREEGSDTGHDMDTQLSNSDSLAGTQKDYPDVTPQSSDNII